MANDFGDDDLEHKTNVGPPPARPAQNVARPPPRPGGPGPGQAPRPQQQSMMRPAPRPTGEAPAMRPRGSAPRPMPSDAARRFWPHAPRTQQETGLSATYIEELCCKHLFQAGELRASDLAQRAALPNNIVEESLERLRRGKLCDIKGSGGAGIGRSAMIYILTEAGHSYTKMSMERDRYIGPAPVPFTEYVESVSAQTIRGNRLTRPEIEPHFKGLVIKDEVYEAIGPAMNSGKALFFYGPPGNGKTAVCARMTNCFGGDVFIPHAIIVDDFVVKVFDATVHIPIDEAEENHDARWVRCRRPMVVVGGELMLEQLDLAYSPEVKYYEAPFQMKANCGMLLVDDFGRQKVSPKDLLNRWIVPLESEYDFLTLHTGKKLKVPFDVFVTFSTNLDPSELVDAAFLRRVRYKLEVSRPDELQYREIFQGEAKKKNVYFEPQDIDYLVKKHYVEAKRPFNACEPRDLLGQVIDLCAYMGIEPQLTQPIIDKVIASYFVRFDQPKKW
ncbi:MAG: ATPase [Myxococcales bacterium]